MARKFDIKKLPQNEPQSDNNIRLSVAVVSLDLGIMDKVVDSLALPEGENTSFIFALRILLNFSKNPIPYPDPETALRTLQNLMLQAQNYLKENADKLLTWQYGQLDYFIMHVSCLIDKAAREYGVELKVEP